MTCFMHGKIESVVSDMRVGDPPAFAIRALNERGDDVSLFFDTRADALNFAMELSFAIMETPEDKEKDNGKT